MTSYRCLSTLCNPVMIAMCTAGTDFRVSDVTTCLRGIVTSALGVTCRSSRHHLCECLGRIACCVCLLVLTKVPAPTLLHRHPLQPRLNHKAQCTNEVALLVAGRPVRASRGRTRARARAHAHVPTFAHVPTAGPITEHARAAMSPPWHT